LSKKNIFFFQDAYQKNLKKQHCRGEVQ